MNEHTEEPDGSPPFSKITRADQEAYNNYIADETDFETKSVDCDGCHHTFTPSQLTNGLMGHSLCDDCHLREMKEKRANLKYKLQNLKDPRDRDIMESQIRSLSAKILKLDQQYNSSITNS